MRVHTVTLTIAFCAAAALPAATASTSVAAPPAAPVAARQSAGPVLVDCLWHQVVRPADYVLACGDGNSRLTSLHWSSWGSDSATATGVNAVNDCRPYCAAGRFHDYPVVVRLDSPQSWKKQPQVQHFTRMTLEYTGARPAGFPREVTFPLWN
ncbi:hypothetical protein [Streptomyces sp. NPDC005423]|uniref:hypothetical protein n=1 Tax=Streptomyces sp. NPDC005423 TaxID=3155343 RepID=UPI0033A1A790